MNVRVALAMTMGAALLAGCASTRTPAPVSDRRPATAPQAKPASAPPATAARAPAGTGTYVVKRGDTLYSIALEHGMDYREVAEQNGIDDPSKLRVGQVLRIGAAAPKPPVQVGTARGSAPVEARPLDGSAAPPSQTAPAGGALKTAPKAVRLPYSQENVALLKNGDAAKPAAAAPPKPEAIAKAEPRPEPVAPAAAPEPGAIEFIWPHRGRVLQGFAEPNNKGVDIAGKPGDSVVAAAPGRVMYIGTGIRGYGKLIVIKHDNNYNSVYAHNREILVKEGQTVARGQKIAELGDTDADTPKLHFEIRQSGKPVDPLRYLPRL